MNACQRICIILNTLGERLREERERLGFSQTAFGEIGGVKKLAQLNYEKNERLPSVTYLDNLRKNTLIDVGYILGGLRDNNERKHLMAESLVNCLIAIGLDIDPESFSSAIGEAYNHEVADFLDEPTVNDKFTTVNNLIDDAINSSSRIINFDLLESVVTELETILITSELKVTPERKAAAIAMLYRSFKPIGKIDKKMISDTIQLAAS